MDIKEWDWTRQMVQGLQRQDTELAPEMLMKGREARDGPFGLCPGLMLLSVGDTFLLYNCVKCLVSQVLSWLGLYYSHGLL